MHVGIFGRKVSMKTKFGFPKESNNVVLNIFIQQFANYIKSFSNMEQFSFEAERLFS